MEYFTSFPRSHFHACCSLAVSHFVGPSNSVNFLKTIGRKYLIGFTLMIDSFFVERKSLVNDFFFHIAYEVLSSTLGMIFFQTNVMQPYGLYNITVLQQEF